MSDTYKDINRKRILLNDSNRNGLPKNDAIIKNESLLEKNPYTYIPPERVESFEAGY